jgi:hydrogenase maturation factor HypE
MEQERFEISQLRNIITDKDSLRKVLENNLNLKIMENISVNYMGMSLKSPVIAASSGLTTQLDKIESFEKAGVEHCS